VTSCTGLHAASNSTASANPKRTILMNSFIMMLTAMNRITDLPDSHT
jgi:hypothetical protein